MHLKYKHFCSISQIIKLSSFHKFKLFTYQTFNTSTLQSFNIGAPHPFIHARRRSWHLKLSHSYFIQPAASLMFHHSASRRFKRVHVLILGKTCLKCYEICCHHYHTINTRPATITIPPTPGLPPLPYHQHQDCHTYRTINTRPATIFASYDDNVLILGNDVLNDIKDVWWFCKKLYLCMVVLTVSSQW